MKVKLLKKIRKRYVITRIDELASNASSTKIDAKNKLGLPLYCLSDRNGTWLKGNIYTNTIDNAKIVLLEWIRYDYYEKIKHSDGKATKIWYNK